MIGARFAFAAWASGRPRAIRRYKGSRMGGEIPKQYRLLAGKPVLAHAVDALASHPAIAEVRVVIGDGQEEMARQALGQRDVGELITGGAERADSVRAGLGAIAADVVGPDIQGDTIPDLNRKELEVYWIQPEASWSIRSYLHSS